MTPRIVVTTDTTGTGPIPTTANGNKYILVASDYFTRWVEAYAISNQEATTVAGKLVDKNVLPLWSPRAASFQHGGTVQV